MSRRSERAVVYLTVALLAWGAIRVMRPLPERKAGVVLSGARTPSWERADSLAAGETLTRLLMRGGVDDDEAQSVIDAARGLDLRRLPAGMRVTMGGEGDSTSRIVLHLGIDRLLHLTRSDSGWTAREERLPWTVDTTVVDGKIESNLSEAFSRGAAAFPRHDRLELAYDVADVFEYRVDMSRDLKEGDRFAVVVERESGPGGRTRVGRVLAVEFVSDAETTRVFRLEAPGRPRAAFFDHTGKSMEAMFLRAPLEFRRISSRFGMRRHPILGVFRQHKGTDYAATSGTPVRTIGDGVVVRAGRISGFGNVVDVRHPNGYVSRYGHLRAFAAGIRQGARVSIGETIGFVGMTGLATAPHLHFELLVGGVQRPPGLALESETARPLDASDRELFERTRSHLVAVLARPRGAAESATVAQ